MVGRGSSEVVDLRNKMKILEGAVWALVDRVATLEEMAEELKRIRRVQGNKTRARKPSD